MKNFSLPHVFFFSMLTFFLNPVSSEAGVVDLPRTGQTTCYDAAGTLIACAGTGQDGEIQAGLAWPTLRFAVGGGAEADCVIDHLTGLMWVRSPEITLRTWSQSIDYANNLTLCGYSDWRLSNVNELENLVHSGQSDPSAWLNTQGFSNVQPDRYWSSNTYAGATTDAWNVGMHNGLIYPSTKTYYYFYAWPVRSAQAGLISLPKTGQTISYAAGDDGDLEAGTAWPGPRFTVNGDCVTDELTGLIWMRSPDTAWYDWQAALDSANGLGLCGFNDWRLANAREFHTLADYSRSNPSLPAGHPFLNVQSNYYWTSTTNLYSNVTGQALSQDLYGGGRVARSKSNATFNYVWAVRGGSLSHALTVALLGTGGGAVTSNPPGIDCGLTCQAVYTAGTGVTLTAAPNPGSSFGGWGGDADCLDGVVTMDANKSCTATFNQILFEETDPAVGYTGTWTPYACAACSGGGLKYSNQTGARATFSFSGTGIKWITAKGPMMGKARVYLDGVNMGLVDLYSSTVKVNVVLQKMGLTPGAHTLAIEVSGQKNPSATGYIVTLDALEVVP